MKLQIKTVGMLVWVLALTSTVHAEPKPSDKLIGTWVYSGDYPDSNGVEYIEITKEKIVSNVGKCSYDGGCGWTDNKDGQSITVHDYSRGMYDDGGMYYDDDDDGVFSCFYFVTDKYLYSCFGGDRDSFLFLKGKKRNIEKLLGEWIIRQPDMDISVTITSDKIIYKKGKLTEEQEMKFETEVGRTGKWDDYFFLDDTHVIVTGQIIPENIPLDFPERDDGVEGEGDDYYNDMNGNVMLIKK